VLILVSACRSLHQLLVGVRLGVPEVSVGARLAILHLVLPWVRIQLHHTVVLLVLSHNLGVIHGRCHGAGVEHVLLLLQEHLHGGRS
jgi:hypothetical protein